MPGAESLAWPEECAVCEAVAGREFAAAKGDTRPRPLGLETRAGWAADCSCAECDRDMLAVGDCGWVPVGDGRLEIFGDCGFAGERVPGASGVAGAGPPLGQPMRDVNGELAWLRTVPYMPPLSTFWRGEDPPDGTQELVREGPAV